MKEEASIQSHEASPPVSQHQNVCVHIDLDQLHSTKLCSISFYNQFLDCDCECRFVFSVQMATMMFMGVMVVESNITEGKQKCTPGVASENQSDLRQQLEFKKVMCITVTHTHT